jgi:prefoldin subunit 5
MDDSDLSENHPYVLKEKMMYIDEDIKEIKLNHREISKKIDDLQFMVLQNGKTNWVGISTIGGVILAVIIGLSNLVFSPIQSDINTIKETVKTMVPREEHMAKWAAYDKEIIHLQDDIKALDASKMSRQEVEELKAALNARIAELNSRLGRKS